MDNATHTLCGLALARAGVDRFGPLATLTCVVAANLPDADIVGALFGGRPWYLCHHRGLTHAVVGLALQSVLLAGVVLGVARARGREARFGPLWLAAALGLASHLALDGLNTYGVRPWLPFVERWYYGDVAFIVDPWLWLGFGLAASLGAPRPSDDPTRWRPHAGWCFFAAAGVAFLSLHAGRGRAPAGVPALWGAAMAAILALRWRGLGAQRRRQAAAAGIGLALLYLLGLAGLSHTAEARARTLVAERTPAPLEEPTTSPRPAVPWRFQVLVPTRERVYEVEVDLLTGATTEGWVLPRGLDDPAVEAVTGRPEHEAWRTFARIPFVGRAAGQLILGDARYLPRPEPGWCNLAVPLPAGER